MHPYLAHCSSQFKSLSFARVRRTRSCGALGFFIGPLFDKIYYYPKTQTELVNPVVITEKVTHIDSLTWVRGVAAFLVVVSHTFRASQSVYSHIDVKAESIIFRFLDLGDFGVSLFFSLSGCALYLSSGQMAISSGVREFYVKRIARIWPAFFVSILIYLVLSIFFKMYYSQPRGLWIEFLLKEWSIADLISYLTLTSDLFGPMYTFNNVYWSMPIEFQFYLIFPLLLWLHRVAGLSGVIFVSFALYIIGWLKITPIADHRFFTMAYMFIGGMLCAHYYSAFKFKFSPRTSLLILIGLLFLVSAMRNNLLPLLPFPILNDKFTWYGCAAIASILVLLKTEGDLIGPGPLHRFLMHYGNISYSTYLYHNVFIAISVLLVIGYDITNLHKLSFIFFVTAIGTYLLASISYEYVEKPWIYRAKIWAKSRRIKIATS